jgi:hypothetical protein
MVRDHGGSVASCNVASDAESTLAGNASETNRLLHPAAGTVTDVGYLGCGSATPPLEPHRGATGRAARCGGPWSPPGPIELLAAAEHAVIEDADVGPAHIDNISHHR